MDVIQEESRQIIDQGLAWFKDSPKGFIITVVIIALPLLGLVLIIFIPPARQTFRLVMGYPFKWINKRLEPAGTNAHSSQSAKPAQRSAIDIQTEAKND